MTREGESRWVVALLFVLAAAASATAALLLDWPPEVRIEPWP